MSSNESKLLRNFFYRDLNLRVCTTGEDINKRLDGVVEKTTVDNYLRYRQHALVVLVKIKMQIHDEATLNQLEDVLGFGNFINDLQFRMPRENPRDLLMDLVTKISYETYLYEQDEVKSAEKRWG